MLPQVLGGIGLFLLGLHLMTDGLKSLAGDSLRNFLVRFAGGPVKAILFGAATTALIQSSSATTLMTIGLVSAGLLQLRQAVGLVMGASIGTTSTGWIVATLGFKMDLLSLALPLVGVGAIAGIVGRGRLRQLGLVLAGFGLIFIGIDYLQNGMKSLRGEMDPQRYTGDGVQGLALMVVTGTLMTLIMQSSSAAVATTLAALHSGALDLVQAAHLVIGHSIGTTVTSAVAGLGATVVGKRTALSHVLLNTSTAAVAFLLWPLFQRILSFPPFGDEEPELKIALFHTFFTITGVLFHLPLLGRLVHIVERLIPQTQSRLTRRLDPTILRAPGEVAIEATRRTVIEIAAAVVGAAREVISGRTSEALHARLQESVLALHDARRFIAFLDTGDRPQASTGQISVLHAIDHAERLAAIIVSCDLESCAVLRSNFPDLLDESIRALENFLTWSVDRTTPSVPLLETLSARVAEKRKNVRERTLDDIAHRTIDPEGGRHLIEGMLKLDQVIYHVWRLCLHLAQPVQAALPTEEISHGQP
ncbi:MAG: Na/Pi cotransporter family protein [Spirochaetales bacterium]|nr:Na/Pi cotransporter family protein [Spirochaetales bacterium]